MQLLEKKKLSRFYACASLIVGFDFCHCCIRRLNTVEFTFFYFVLSITKCVSGKLFVSDVLQNVKTCLGLVLISIRNFQYKKKASREYVIRIIQNLPQIPDNELKADAHIFKYFNKSLLSIILAIKKFKLTCDFILKKPTTQSP